MKIGLSDITYSFRSFGGSEGISLKHGHAQQLLVAALGYKTLASYQTARASDQEPESFDPSGHVVLDRTRIAQRAAELGIECDTDQLSGLLTKAFGSRLAGVVLHHSFSDLDDYIRKQITHLVENNGRVIGEMSQLNHDGLEEVYFDLEVDFDQTQVGGYIDDNIIGHVSLNRDPERPYTGTKINFQASLKAERHGKRCYSGIELEVMNVTARAPWDYDTIKSDSPKAHSWATIEDDDGEPPVRTKAEVIAELLGWEVDEVEGLEDVDEMPLDGSSGEMTYGFCWTS